MLSTAHTPSLDISPDTFSASANRPSASSGTKKPYTKMATPGKTLDGARKQAGSPIDAPLKKQPQKAWTGGSNPITQRPSNASTSNGVSNTTKPSTSTSPASAMAGKGTSIQDSQTSDKHANDRLFYVLSACKGMAATFTLKNSQQYSAVLSGASIEAGEQRYVFKMVKRIQPDFVNGNGPAEEYAGVGDDHIMIVDMTDVTDLSIKSVGLDKNQIKPQNGSTSFRTDADISGNLSFRKRNLQRWEPENENLGGLSLDDGANSHQWDQFEANERLYGLKSNYDEDIYTTKIDRSNPLYKQRAAEAERIAREIVQSTASNSHIAEERGLAVDDSGLDEEDKYSGVRRDFVPLPTGQPNKYTPPARRAPTGQPTVTGAPVDPAIISSQIAQPASQAVPKSTPEVAAEENKTVSEPQKAEETQKQETMVPAPAEKPKSKSPAPSDAKAAPSKAAAEPNQKTTSAQKPVANLPTAAKKPGKPDSATTNVEHELLDQFKQFSANEKLRIQERQRTMARHDKAVKINDLKSFSKTFKLHTPVPQDLVPILAKDEAKQKSIVEKALRNVNDHKTVTPPKATAPPAPAADSKSSTRQAPSKYEQQQHTSPTVERQTQARQRQGQGNYGNGSGSVRSERPVHGSHMQQMPARGTNTLLSQRLAISQQQHKAGSMQQPGYHQPIQIPAAGPSGSSSGGQTPTGLANRFNVGAAAFIPNAAAPTFRPGGNTSSNASPRVETPVRQEPRPIKITPFFLTPKPSVASDLSVLDKSFNVVRRLKEAHTTDEYASNGGIPPAFKTGPTWDVLESNRDTTHKDMFDRMNPTGQPLSAPQASLGGVPVPYQHQLPPNHQQMPPTGGPHHTPHHTPRHPAAQPHHGPGPHHFEGGHPMQFSASTSSVHPSPRPAQPYMYGPQAPQGMPPNVMFQQPPYGMSPGMQNVHLRQPAPGQYTQVPGVGGHMMAQQPSGGHPYMVPINPQMQVYSPAPGQVYPHPGMAIPAPPGANGFSSPRPMGAQMMQHSSSQQGQPPQPIMYMPTGQPSMYAHMPAGPMNTPGRHHPQPYQMPYGSPHQGSPYPQRGTPSATYSQPMMPSHSMGGHPPQMVPPNGPSAHVPNGDEAK